MNRLELRLELLALCEAQDSVTHENEAYENAEPGALGQAIQTRTSRIHALLDALTPEPVEDECPYKYFITFFVEEKNRSTFGRTDVGAERPIDCIGVIRSLESQLMREQYPEATNIVIAGWQKWEEA